MSQVFEKTGGETQGGARLSSYGTRWLHNLTVIPFINSQSLYFNPVYQQTTGTGHSPGSDCASHFNSSCMRCLWHAWLGLRTKVHQHSFLL